MKLREVRFDDHSAVAAVLARNGLRTPTLEQWKYFWTDVPDGDRLSRVPMGWVLEDEACGLVGTFRNVACLYEWNGRPITVAVASAWAVDPAHRRASLGLAAEYFRQRQADVLLNTTAVEETSGKAFLAFGAKRVPQPSYTERLLWITGHAGFASGLARQRRVPGALIAGALAGGLMWAFDRMTGRNQAAVKPSDAVRLAGAFDERFDRFWDTLRQQANRLRAVRDRRTLTWRFQLERRRPTIVVLEEGTGLGGYAVLVERHQPEIGVHRMEVADFQVLADDSARVRTLMRGVLSLVSRQGIHLIAMSGQSEAKRQALGSLKPYRKRVPGWPLYYKAVDAALQEPLQSPDAWDMSLYDGDMLWSGAFDAGSGPRDGGHAGS